MLLIEDEPNVARSFTRLLELDDVHVDWVADGETGLAMAREGAYDAILLDRLLPRLSGDRVLEYLKTEGNPTPVIILTGHPDADSAFRAARLGAAGYLEKGGLTGAELSGAVRKAVATARAGTVPAAPVVFSQVATMRSEGVAALVTYLGSSEGVDRVELARVLAGALIAVDLTEAEFVAVAKSLRLVQSKPHLPLSLVRATISRWVQGASHPATIGSGQATMHEQHLAMVMRYAVLQLATSDEYVSQIAYGLGYSDAANFDHDFRKFLGMAPRAFRRLL